MCGGLVEFVVVVVVLLLLDTTDGAVAGCIELGVLAFVAFPAVPFGDESEEPLPPAFFDGGVADPLDEEEPPLPVEGGVAEPGSEDDEVDDDDDTVCGPA